MVLLKNIRPREVKGLLDTTTNLFFIFYSVTGRANTPLVCPPP